MSRFSVIMPTYNYGRYILDSIRSVQQQTVDDWELVIVDDGSDDDTEEKVAAVADSRIRYFTQPNQGVSAARNFGLKVARGDYIAFLDADDLMVPNRLADAARILDAHRDVDIVFANFDRFVEGGDWLPDQFTLTPDWKRLQISWDASAEVWFIDGDAFSQLTALQQSLCWIQTVTIRQPRASAHEFPVGVRLCEDAEYIYRSMIGARLAFTDRIWAHLRRHGANSYSGGREMVQPYFEMLERIGRSGISDFHLRAVRRALARSLCAQGWHLRKERSTGKALAAYARAGLEYGAVGSALRGVAATLLRV